MRRAALVVVLAAACAAPPMRTDHELVDVGALRSGIVLDIRYATKDNVFGEAVYPSGRCLLVKPAAERLVRVHKGLAARGLGLKVWDCYRPLAVQKRLWELKPDPRFVAPPERGSRHNRGAAVDVTLVDAQGRELEMPSRYDDFGPSAHRGWKGAPKPAALNRRRLEEAMALGGFLPLAEEWWHFDDPDWERFPLLDIPL